MLSLENDGQGRSVRNNGQSASFRIWDNGYIVPAFLIAIVNILFLQLIVISALLVGLEILVLLFYLYKMDIEKYVCWLLVFLATSIEFQVLVSGDANAEIYNFKTFRLFGFNLSLIFVTLPFFLMVLVNLYRGIFKLKPSKILTAMLLLLLLMVDGVTMGVVNLAVDDNGIRGLSDWPGLFLGEIYLGSWPIILFCLTYYALVHSKQRGTEMEKALVAVFFSNCTAPLLPAMAGVTGSYGTHEYMLVSSSAMLTPFLVLLPAYNRYSKTAVSFFVLFVLGCVLPMILFSYVSGKHILILGLIPVIYLLIQIKKKNLKTREIVFVVTLAAIIFSAFSFMQKSKGSLFESKFNEVVSLVEVWRPDYANSLEPSSGFRIFEAINLFIEYQNKPGQVVLGKGYMGSVHDYISSFGWDPSGAFPIEQFDNQTFYQLHEITGYLLRYGILGIVVWFFILKLTLANIANNPWVVIGCYWFLLFFGFSQTISVFGVISLAYGLFLVDHGGAASAAWNGVELTSRTLTHDAGTIPLDLKEV